MAKRKKLKKSGARETRDTMAAALGLNGLGPTVRMNGKGVELRGPRRRSTDETDPRKQAFTARCNALGLAPSSKNRTAVNVPYLGSEIGLVLHHLKVPHAEIMEIWSYWRAFCAAQETYRKRIIGVSIHPPGAALVMVSEPVAATPEDEPDVRTAEERNEDAIAAYQRWDRILGRGMDPQLRVALFAAERGDGPALWREGEPTAHGYRAAQAIQHMVKLAQR